MASLPSLPPRLLSVARVLALFASASTWASDGHSAHDAPAPGGTAGVELMTEERQDLMSPTQAYELLVAGNERFRTGKTLAKDVVAQRKATAHGQHPYATILSCMDSRTSSEVIFDANLGDFFNIRIAGNVINDDILGSMEYAHKVAGAKLILVLGHTHCGAIKGAADDVVMGNLTGLLARVRPAVTAIPPDGKPRTSKNLEFVDRAGRMNVILAVRQIRERSALLRDMQDRGLIDILGAFYDLETGRVEFYRPLSGSGPIRTTTTLIAPEKPAKGHGEKADDTEDASHPSEDAHGETPEAPAHGDAPEHGDAHSPAASTPAEVAPTGHAEHGEPTAKAPPAKREAIVPNEEADVPAEPEAKPHGH